jgi:DNA repair exonuclease SbcCD ATPase subunit
MAEDRTPPSQDTSYQIMRIFDDAIAKQRSEMNEAVETFIRAFSASGGFNITKAQAVTGLRNLGNTLIETNQKAMHQLSIETPRKIRALYSAVEETLRNQVVQYQTQISQLQDSSGNEIAKLRTENQELLNKLKTVAEQTEQLLQHVDKQAHTIRQKEREIGAVRSELQKKIDDMHTERQMERLADEKEIENLKQTIQLLEDTRQSIDKGEKQEGGLSTQADEETIKKAISALNDEEEE